ncbi:ArsB/NhaD family transporter [Amycolatopsis sp. A133]|uniref:SLC13 family permease n=1 Tax=Amycolatopsis sp. A133 TaxID=3064472 RepID=UPI0027F828B7|nr:SLC13 family permease [Amycolatopsis sp. A133]MDQ7808556.1 ArsB/NhaD family transporter [Amycolatopsis sp. A133]
MTRLRTLLAKPGVLDWIRIGLLVAGVLCVLTGLLPVAEAKASMSRIAPLLLFLGSVIVLATLARHAQVFDAIAARLARIGQGNYPALFLLCVAFATVTTVVLNLDTTAVLLTPVFLALAPKAKIAALPLAMTTLWLANTASLLLPVSNLTNLLAADRVALAAPAFAARMWAPQLASVAATMVFLWVCYWRRGRRGGDRYLPPPPVELDGARSRVLFRVAGAACLLFILAIPFIRDEIGYAAAVAAAVVVLAFAVLDRAKLRLSLIPWQLLVFVTGLFLVVPTLSRYGLSELMTGLIGSDGGGLGEFRAAAAGAALSNVVNNLPAYTAGEAVVPPGNGDQLLALLIGTNVGPIVTPWASLATLLCLESCRRHELRVPMGRFVRNGFGLAVLALVMSVAALRLTR